MYETQHEVYVSSITRFGNIITLSERSNENIKVLYKHSLGSMSSGLADFMNPNVPENITRRFIFGGGSVPARFSIREIWPETRKHRKIYQGNPLGYSSYLWNWKFSRPPHKRFYDSKISLM